MPGGPDPNPGDLPATDSPGDALTRSFGWSDMFVRPEDDPRTDGGFHDERTTLTGYLRDYRLTIELKCSGLDAAGMACRSVEPSNLSLLGLVRHLADVERHWFRQVLASWPALRRGFASTAPTSTGRRMASAALRIAA
ncbi:MAG TPA: DUF664 domain-containing protein, partial [Streptosporangiaceae bacterium]